MPSSTAPIGIFDSGVGGLSVAREIRRLLPHEDIVYYADSAFCPYGDKDPAIIRRRELTIVDFLVKQGAKIIVVACNTASSTGLEELRKSFTIPIVGMEPAVKPAVAASKSGRIGVLATCVTIAGDRFSSLVKRFAENTTVITQPCPGLVELIEEGKLDEPETEEVLKGFLQPVLGQNADTLVLGCTHYPFLRPLVQRLAGPEVAVIDSGFAVARQVSRLLYDLDLINEGSSQGIETFYTSGDQSLAERVIGRLWIRDNISVQRVPLTS
ncbi:hypothetical protein N752_09950 [Desulforamulus aquiferis]|nr:glutamate racemase [Desulforamulus aquiferis]RYD05287.1 hypothetical protein N752_09950 [Desulforamulus aquiferis]